MNEKKSGLPKQCSSCGGGGCGKPCQYGDKPVNELKPCAFCGSLNNHLSYSHDSMDNIPLYTINCAECNARTGIYDKLSAIKAWNARA